MTHNLIPPSEWIKKKINNFYQENKHKKISMIDIACGNGRHVKEFHKKINITAVDLNLELLKNLHFLENVKILNLDVESKNFLDNFNEKFDIVLITNFLYRPLIPKLFDTVLPNGMILFETFGKGNEKYGRPKNPKYLLKKNELKNFIPDKFNINEYFHGVVEKPKKSVKQFLCAINTSTV